MMDTACSPIKIDDFDQTLINSIRQGNKKSFEQLMKKHQTSIFLMVYRQIRQREEAEDVVQQVFLQAYQHLGKFRGESKFSTWLYTIALNLVRNHVRQRNMRRMDSLDVSGEIDDSRGPQWPDKSPSTEDIVHHRRELEQVMNALEIVTDPYRTIFMLHYFQHVSLNDVATRVGRPVGTVKVYLHRTRIMVLNQLQKQNKKE